MAGDLTAKPKCEDLQPVSNGGTGNLFYLRLLAFCIIEGAFIALAAKCLIYPTPLEISLRFKGVEVAHGFTIISILWQTLAAMAAEHIITDAFSREWTAQRGNIVPGKTDRVSVITSGFLDRTIHLFTRCASGTFKIAFLASFLLLTLTKLAPGTISAVTNPVNVPTQIQVGALLSDIDTSDVGFPGWEVFDKIMRVRRVVDLERNENSLFGLKLQPNRLVLYPVVDPSTLDGAVEYDSDVIEFHYDCYWKAPNIVDKGRSTTVMAGGWDWRPRSPIVLSSSGLEASIILPLASAQWAPQHSSLSKEEEE